MPNAIYEFTAFLREKTGKAAARRLRLKEDKVPGVLYGAGEMPKSITLGHTELLKALGNESVFAHILTLHFGDQQEKVIIKDLQRHPVKPKILHIDFLRVKATEKLTLRVPLHFIGEEQCAGVKQGGLISHLVNEVEIKCLPADLPQFIEVDVSGLSLGQSLHLQDLTLPTGVELAVALDEEHNLPIVNVHLPRVQKEEESAPVLAAAPVTESAPKEAEGKTREGRSEKG